MKRFLVLGAYGILAATLFAGVAYATQSTVVPAGGALVPTGTSAQMRAPSSNAPHVGVRNSDCSLAEPILTSAGTHTVPVGGYQYFSYTGIGVGLNIETNLAGTDCDSDLYIFSDCDHLVDELYYVDGISPDYRAYLTDGSFTFEAGVDYIIAFTEYYGDGGNIEFTVSEGVLYPVPANDECVNAIAVNTYPSTVTGTTNGATIDCPENEDIDDWNAVWYAIDLPNADNDVWIDYCGMTESFSTMGIILLENCGCEEEPLIAPYYGWDWDCGDTTTKPYAFWTQLAGPTTLYLPIYLGGGMDFSFNIDVTPANYAPTIDNLTILPHTEVAGPYTVSADVVDPESGLTDVSLVYAVNGGTEVTLSMTAVGDTYSAAIPAVDLGDEVTYAVTATDGFWTTTSAAASFEYRAVQWPPTSFAATEGEFGDVSLTWSAPVMPPPANMESFESGMPADWTYYNEDGDSYHWEAYATAVAYDGGYVARVQYNSSGNNDWLVTNARQGTATSEITYQLANYYSSYPESYEVYAMASATVPTAADFVASGTLLTSGTLPTGTAWHEFSHDLSAFDGQQVYIAFRCTSVDEYYLYLDAVVFDDLDAVTVVASAGEPASTDNDLEGMMQKLGLSKDQAMARIAAEQQIESTRAMLGYNVYRESVLIATTMDLFYDDVPPLPETDYTYYVTAVYDAGESDPSDTAVGSYLVRPTSGGPDLLGYTWIHSDDASGPAYAWTDIVATGTAATLTSDDSVDGPFAIGFEFPFYENSYTEFYVNSNGLVTFGASSTAFSNVQLPNTATPNNLIAAFWDDLNPTASDPDGTVYYLYDSINETLTVQYNLVANGGTVEFAFQTILMADGNILVQIQNVDENDVVGATVGIENADGTSGLSANFNGDGCLLADGVAILFERPDADVFPPALVVTPLDDTEITSAPYTVSAEITDASGIGSAVLYYQVSAGGYTSVAMTNTTGDTYTADIPAQTAGALIDYYVEATDLGLPTANTATSSTYSFEILNYTFPPSSFNATDGEIDVVELTWGVPRDPSAFFEGFENGIPATWTNLNVDAGSQMWTAYNSGVYEGSYCAAVRYESSSLVNNDWLITPALDVTAASVLSFMTKRSGTYYPDAMDVAISTTDTDPASFTTVLQTISADAATYHEVAIALSAYDGMTVYIGFHYYGDDEMRRYIDNVEVTGIATRAAVASEWSTPVEADAAAIRAEVKGKNVSAAELNALLNPADNASRAFLNYEVYRDDVAIATTANLFYDDTPPVAEQVYNYYVKAIWDGGTSDASDSDTGYFILEGPTLTHTALDDTEFAGPYAVTVDAVSVSGTTVTGVSLFWSLDGVNFTEIEMTQTTAPAWDAQLPAVAAPAEYEYYFVAVDDAPSSTTSYSYWFTLYDYTAAPQNFIASDGRPDDIYLDWDSPVTTVTMESLVEQGMSKEEAEAVINENASRDFQTYVVYRDGVAIDSTTNTYYYDYTGVEYQVYEYTVTALWDGGESAGATDTGYFGRDTQGGPDAFGYRWINSVNAAGPVYNWIEAGAGVGTELDTLTGHDDARYEFTLPRAFNFYGNDYTQMMISVNGWVAFDTDSTGAIWNNKLLPDTLGTNPDLMICPFWDDLGTLTGAVYTYDDAANGRFIIQWDAVGRLSGTTPSYTFQLILNDNGEILVQYNSMTGIVNSATVGIENEDATIGLSANYNDAGGLIADGVAVLFTTASDCAEAVIDIACSGNNAVLSWAAVAGATDYRVLAATEAYGTYTELGVTGGALTYTDSGAVVAGYKFYKVVAVCE